MLCAKLLSSQITASGRCLSCFRPYCLPANVVHDGGEMASETLGVGGVLSYIRQALLPHCLVTSQQHQPTLPAGSIGRNWPLLLAFSGTSCRHLGCNWEHLRSAQGACHWLPAKLIWCSKVLFTTGFYGAGHAGAPPAYAG